MSVTLYMSGRAKKLRTLPQIIEGETKAALRRGQNRLRKALGEEFASRGVGQAILSGRVTDKRLKAIIAREPLKKSGALYTVAVKVKGIAAIVAKGGRTMAHGIGATGKILSNPAAGFFARGRVNHPGSQMRRDDFPARAVAKTAGSFRTEVNKGMDRVAAVVNGG